MSITHDEIALRLNLARSTVTRILNNDPNYRASKATREKVFALAKQLNYDFSNLRRIHRRRFERVKVRIRVRAVILLQDGRVFDEGRAVIFDLNPVGALVGDFDLPGGSIPLRGFKLSLRFVEGLLAGMQVDARIVRITVDKTMQMGVEFINTTHADMKRIADLVQLPFSKQSLIAPHPMM